MIHSDNILAAASSYFREGGEMGALMRAKDWKKNRLGDPENWPQSLRMAVAMMLENPFGMYIAWGPDFIQLYNDGFRPILGSVKHPEALGTSTRKTFEEIWWGVGPMFDSVMEGKAVRITDQEYRLNRNGFEEDCWFDFACSPIRLDNGSVGGVLVTVVETTSKKTIEKKQTGVNQQLEFAIEAAELATWDYNPLTDTFTSNQRLKEWFGLPENAAIELSTAMAVIAENDRERVSHAIQQVLNPASGGKYDIEYTIIHPVTRLERIVRTKGLAWFGPDNTACRLNGTIQDITQQAMARTALEKSGRLHETITNNTPDLIYIFGLDYRFTYANSALLTMWGKTWENAVGKTLLENGYEPWHADMHEQEIDQVIATKNNIRGTVSFPHAELGKRVYDYIFAPVLNENGEVEAIAGTTRDITDITLAEQEVKGSEERFRTLAETLPQLVWVTDADGHQEYVSGRWKEYAGIEPADELTWQQIVHPDDMQRMGASWAKSLSSGMRYREEVRLKNIEGHYLWHFVQGEAIRNENGDILKWIGAFTNIHEQKMKEQQKDDFISIASHEMKTPLTTAKGFIQLLDQTYGGKDENADIFIKKAGQAINKLQNLVKELLDASTIQNGRLDYKMAAFDFNDLISETIEIVQAGAGRHHIQNKNHVSRQVTGDKDRLQQVLVNLLNNAIKYSPDADKVVIDIKEEENVLLITIHDFGIGMGSQHLDKVFDRYYRIAEHADHFQGLGIGLYISHQIIYGHGGHMWVESDPGKGSRFHFTLPFNNLSLSTSS